MKNSIILFAVLLSVVTGCSTSPDETIREKIRPVRYITIDTQRTTPDKSFSGVAISSNETHLSFKVSGNINKVLVKKGESVKKGQLLSVLDPVDYSLQFDQANIQQKQAQFQIEQAETNLNTSESAYIRTEKLFELNSVSQNDYEKARAHYDAAKAQYESALAQENAAKNAVKMASNQISYTRMYAPFDGVINDVYVEEKENIQSGYRILTVSSDDMIEISVQIPEKYINEIKPKQKSIVRFSALEGQDFEGEITEIPFASDRSSTFPVLIRLSKSNDSIRPGMAASVIFQFANPSDNKIIIPAQAVAEDRKGKYVLSLSESENGIYTTHRQAVEIGSVTNEGIEITSGVSGGSKIVTAGISKISDSTRVTLLQP